MKEYYSIPLEDEEAQTLLDISRLIDDKPIKSVSFLGDIDSALDDVDFGATFWFEDHHVIGLRFLHSKLNSLPDSIGNLSYLRFIFIEDSPIRIIPSTFKKLRDLERLILINNPETAFIVNIDFPDIFKHLKNFKVFHIYGLFNVYLPPSFEEMENLEELHLEHCLFSTNRSNFMLNYNLKDPYLITQPFHELPDELGKLKSLKKLVLSYLDIEYLPTSLNNLTSIKELDLSHSKKIKNIDNIFEIITLESLNLYYCEIKTLSNAVSKLTNLKTLNLAHNKLQELPSEIRNCQKLEEINLTWNWFEKELRVLTDLPSLKSIIFDKAYPEIIPNELYDKKDLKIKDV